MTTPDGLVFAGKAGSGLTGRTAAALQRRLRARRDCPVLAGSAGVAGAG